MQIAYAQNPLPICHLIITFYTELDGKVDFFVKLKKLLVS